MPIKIEAAPNFLSNFERRYLDNHLTKFDKTFFLNSIASYNSNKKIFIVFSQVVVKISSLKVKTIKIEAAPNFFLNLSEDVLTTI